MVTQTEASADRRPGLTRESVLRAAVDLADRGGVEALSMRKLGQDLGVDPMALYRHVRDKDDILDGVVDTIVAEIEVGPASGDWRSTLRQRALAARQVMLRHPWAPRLIAERTTLGPAVLAWTDAALGVLLDGGLSLELAHHGLHALSSRILGFNQDLFDDSQQGRPPSAMDAETFARTMAATYPRLAELAVAASHEGGLGDCDDDVEFEFGLDLILDALERRRIPTT